MMVFAVIALGVLFGAALVSIFWPMGGEQIETDTNPIARTIAQLAGDNVRLNEQVTALQTRCSDLLDGLDGVRFWKNEAARLGEELRIIRHDTSFVQYTNPSMKAQDTFDWVGWLKGDGRAYTGQWVGIKSGVVIDFDTHRMALMGRIKDRDDLAAIAIVRVADV